MKKRFVYYFAVLFSLFFVFSGACLAGETPTQGPRAVFKETKHEFKPVLEGEMVTYDFHFINEGSKDLEIKQVKTG